MCLRPFNGSRALQFLRRPYARQRLTEMHAGLRAVESTDPTCALALRGAPPLEQPRAVSPKSAVHGAVDAFSRVQSVLSGLHSRPHKLLAGSPSVFRRALAAPLRASPQSTPSEPLRQTRWRLAGGRFPRFPPVEPASVVGTPTRQWLRKTGVGLKTVT